MASDLGLHRSPLGINGLRGKMHLMDFPPLKKKKKKKEDKFCDIFLLALRLPRLGKRELILVLFVRLIDLCLFGFVGFLYLLGSAGLRFVIVALPGLFSYLFFPISFFANKVRGLLARKEFSILGSEFFPLE